MLTSAQTNESIVIAFFPAEVQPNERQKADLELVRRVKSGDQAAFRDLVERHQSKVFSVAHRILRNRQDAEDIAQMVFTKVYFALKRFDCRCSLPSWICKIAINECYSHLRKQRVRAALSDRPGSELIEGENRFGASPETGADTTMAARDLLNKILAKVPEDDRWLLIMKEVEGHSVAELAGMTGAGESAIKTKLFRARQKLIQAAAQLSLRPQAERAVSL